MTKWNWAEGKEGGIPPAPECQLVQSQTWFSEPPGSLARTHGWASPPPALLFQEIWGGVRKFAFLTSSGAFALLTNPC